MKPTKDGQAFLRIASWSLLALGTALVSALASADGDFSMTLRDKYGFTYLQLKEHDGIREGTLNGGYVAAQRTDTEFVFAMGNQTETLNIEQKGDNTYFYGWLYGARYPTTFYYYPEKYGYRIKGTVSQTKFHLSVDRNIHELFVYWMEGDAGTEYNVTLNPVATEVGGCAGNLVAYWGGASTELAKIFCHSSGSMQDAFFSNNPDDVIAWLIHLLVVPAGT